MSEPLLFYSINTYLAYSINKEYYKDKHYVWCSPYFDCRKKSSLERNNPVSSNPCQIYNRLKEDIITSDKHSLLIDTNKLGIKKGVDCKLNAGVITEEQKKEIIQKIRNSQIIDFRPLIYVIPYELIKKRLNIVKPDKKAGSLSIEYIVNELDGSEFDVLEIEG